MSYMDKGKFYTKRPMVLMSSVRVHEKDAGMLREAAAREGISQSEFVRLAIRQRVASMLGGPQAPVERRGDGS